MSTTLPQRAKYKNSRHSIEGFELDDILACAEQSKEIICVYCQQPSASIRCNYESCQRSFHFICGIDNKCLYQFTKDFSSYCHDHHGIFDENSYCENKEICFICYEMMGAYHPTYAIPACCNLGWYHAKCLRKTALHSGYYLKCPTCGTKGTFREQLKLRGIFVPDRDATWELEKSAYKDLLFTYSRCDIANCLCPDGRNFLSDVKRNSWYLRVCAMCGANGAHVLCDELKERVFVCEECRKILKKYESKRLEAAAKEMLQINKDHRKSASEIMGPPRLPSHTLKRIASEPVMNFKMSGDQFKNSDKRVEPNRNINENLMPNCSDLPKSISHHAALRDIEYNKKRKLVTVQVKSDNHFKKRAIILADEDFTETRVHPIDDKQLHGKLREDRLALLWLNRWFSSL